MDRQVTPPTPCTAADLLALVETNDVCRQFERAWFQKQAPRIEDYLPEDESRRASVLCELLAIEWELRRDLGDVPTLDEYLSRFPAFEDSVRSALQCVGAQPESDDATSVEPISLPAGLGEYRIVREIGRGGMGVVYEAVQESLGRRVALKVLPQSVLWMPGVVERFRREAGLVAKLNHPGIVPIHTCGCTDGTLYFVMRIIDGPSLNRLVAQRQAKMDEANGIEPFFEPSWVASIGKQVAEALDYAHRLDILHRDIKPGNLILEGDHHVLLSDFGLAKSENADAGITTTGDLIGTLRYMPPEAIDGHWSRASDVYSLGVTLYELLTLRSAFKSSTHIPLVREVIRIEPPRPRFINPDIPRDLETIILKAMSKSPGDRYATAGELAEDFGRFLDQRPVSARPLGRLEQAQRWARRDPLTSGLSAGVVLSLVLGLLLTSWFYARAKQAADLSMRRLAQQDAAAGLQLIENDNPVASLVANQRAIERLSLLNPIAESRDALPLEAVLRWRIGSVVEQIPPLVAGFPGFAWRDFTWESKWQIDPELYFTGKDQFLCQVNARTGEFRRWNLKPLLDSLENATIDRQRSTFVDGKVADSTSVSRADPSYYLENAPERCALCRDTSIMVVEGHDASLRLYDTSTDDIICGLDNPFQHLGAHRFGGAWISGDRTRLLVEVWCPEITTRIFQDAELASDRSVFGTSLNAWFVWYGFVWDLRSGKVLHNPEQAIDMHHRSQRSVL
ncbi:MAG: serine/threonine-protein kinase [Pirellulaceae bacterium]